MQQRMIPVAGGGVGSAPLVCDAKLEVWDSPGRAGMVIDAIRWAGPALERVAMGQRRGWT